MEGSEHTSTLSDMSEAPNIFSTMFSLLRPSPLVLNGDTLLVLPSVFSTDLPLNRSEGNPENSRRNKKNTACPHRNRKHYAKNMCNNCYHINGRNRHPWFCPLTSILFCAKGKYQQQCYLQSYYIQKKSRLNRSRKDKNNS